MAKKYIDAELLRKEIEYLKAVHIGHAAITKETNAVDGLDAVLQVIDSLQQEQSSEDLEKEMERFLSNITPAFKDGSYKITRLGFRAVARHFYEFGKNSK